MTELKYGGSDVKIMYGSQEIGGATKLEPGTILYMSNSSESDIKNLHLLSTTKNWNNINGINVLAFNDDFSNANINVNVPGDDFKNLNINKSYRLNALSFSANISTSIVDGEYMLNIDAETPLKFIIKAI